MILVKRLIRIGMAARTPKGFAKIFLCKLLGEEMPGLCVNLSLFPPSQARGSEKWGANPPIVKRPHSRNKAGGQKAPKVASGTLRTVHSAPTTRPRGNQLPDSDT